MAKVCAVAAACLALAGSAQAGMRSWQRIAAERFPVTCPVQLYRAPGPSYIYARAEPETCRIALLPSFFGESRAHRCAIVVHEYGHLAGLGHSTDPLSVMYPRAPVVGARRCQKGP